MDVLSLGQELELVVAANAEAVVVGSAVVNQIAERGKAPDLVERVSDFVSTLVNAVKPNER